MSKILTAVFVLVGFKAYAVYGDEDTYHKMYRDECQYMHDILKDPTPVEVCTHVLAFRLSHIHDIDNNAHATKK